MGNDNNQKLPETLTPAQKSACVAEEVNKREKARQLAEENRRREAELAEMEAIEAEAEKLAPEIYADYRRLIAEAEQAGRRDVTTDMEHWAGQYYGERPERSSEELHKASVKQLARDMARKMIEKDGYKIKSDGWQKDTAWGVGSDALPVAGKSCQWITISW